MTDLSGRWTLTRDATGETVPLELPGDGHSALAAAGVIPEPYEGTNEYACRWVSEEDWTATRAFDWPGGEGELVIDGLDCVAEVEVNGREVLRAANAFREQRAGLAGALREGANEIAIRFRSPVREAAARQAAQPWPVPHHPGNCPIPDGNMLRKPQCDFGWDWNVALAPFGVRDGIRIEPARPGRIEALGVEQRLDGGAMVVTVRARGGAEGAGISATLCGAEARGRVEGGRAVLTLRVEAPDLWWPAGLGGQPLHELRVECAGEASTRVMGLREARLVSLPDAAGRSFGMRVNGRDVFCRGASWVPADALPGRIDAEAGRDLLRSAAAAHMNMLRVWGGGRYEAPWFYEECDRLGLMVWQDFMWACHLYPSDDAFLAEARAEAEEVALRLSHHPCIALWCGDNELVGALGWFEESRADRDRYLVAYDRLNRAVEAGLRDALPGAPWWPSSPSAGPMSFADAFHMDGAGDMHVWSVWHEGRDFDHYRTLRPRFVSEFGFQSYPSMDVIRRFASAEDMNVASPVMESHQKNAGGNARIAETMFRAFRFPNAFADFVWLSQVQQAEALKVAVTHWRSLKPHCMGTLYWQLNDTWPVCSWSSLDHGGGWKLAHHAARRFFEPVTVVAVPGQGGRLRLVGVNDGPEPVRLRVRALSRAMDGSAEEIGSGEAEIGEAAATLCEVAAPGPGRVLDFEWEGGARGRDVFAPLAWKSYDLPDAAPGLASARDGEGWRLKLSASAMSFFLTAEASLPGRWDRNMIHLRPGEEAALRFVPSVPGVPEFALRDLRSATYPRRA